MLKGNTATQITNGMATISLFSISVQPPSNIELLFESAAINVDILNVAYPSRWRELFETYNIQIKIWECIAGEIIVQNEC